MENKILNEEIIRISEIMGIQNKILNEQGGWAGFEKELGHDVADALEIGFGKAAARDVDFVLANTLKSTLNFVNKYGIKYLKSAAGTEVPYSKLAQIIKDVADGHLYGQALDDELRQLPRKLADGTEFREPLGAKLRIKSAQVNQGGGHYQGGSSGGGSSAHPGPGGGGGHTPSGGGAHPDPYANIQPSTGNYNYGGMSKQSLENIIYRMRQNPKFSLYEQVVDNLPVTLTDNEKNILLAGYEQYGYKNADELVKIIQDLREKTYGPAKKILTTILQKPLRTAKWISSAIAAVVLVKWVLIGARGTDKAIKKVSDFFSGDESSESDNSKPASSSGDSEGLESGEADKIGGN